MVANPHLIPGFEILDRIGAGGIASVFRAKRERDGLEVALKVMSLADYDPEFHATDRFMLEGELLERLNHPSLPRCYDFGVTDEGLGWLAQEYVRGQPLSAYTGREVIELIPIFIQIADGLQTVAQEGIVHRDIAPDNILVEERRGRPQARLIDFGVAKDLVSGQGSGALTRHGAFLGKLSYASPEQLIGMPKGETLDFRSDVYSFGLTIYEILTGRRAIEARTLPEYIDAHLKREIPKLEIPPDRGGPASRLVNLVHRMIEKRRDDRPGSWEEVLAELWRAREEVSPLSETLRRKGVPGQALNTQNLAPAPTPSTPLPASAAPREPSVPAASKVPKPPMDPLTREMWIGRIVLAIGATAFLGAVIFAIWYFRTH